MTFCDVEGDGDLFREHSIRALLWVCRDDLWELVVSHLLTHETLFEAEGVGATPWPVLGRVFPALQPAPAAD